MAGKFLSNIKKLKYFDLLDSAKMHEKGLI